MIRMCDNTLYVFKHIPKTAGTSVRLQIMEDYDEDELFCFYGDIVTKHCFLNKQDFFNKKKCYTQKQLNQVKILMGHNVTQKIALSFNRPVKYMTIVRHPVERVISLYYHFLRKQDDASLTKAFSELTNVDEVSLKKDFCDWFSRLPFGQSFFSSLVSIKNMNFMKDLCNEDQRFERAKELMNSFDFIGLMDQPETFSKIKKILNLSTSVGHHNIGSYKRNNTWFKEFVEGVITEKWPLDFKIYEYAMQMKRCRDLVS